MKRAAITIDVDSLRHYRAIHGFPQIEIEEDPIYTIAIPRFWDLIEQAGISATLFLIGADAPKYASVFDRLSKTKSEIANHSFAHDYRLTHKPPAVIAEDLRQADKALRPLAQSHIVGFRAPGYNVTPALLTAVQSLGYAYDSSLLPSPAYFVARSGMISAYRLFGRRSRSIIGHGRQFIGPHEPYRIDAETPWRPSANGGLIELPIACFPGLRVPFIGTTYALMPKSLREKFTTLVLRNLDCVNFEMHAIDLLDASDHPMVRELSAVQHDVRVSSREKIDGFARLFKRIASEREVSTLAAIARMTG